ncbi:MAG: NUDIX domain-containing protein [Candidatus Woesearchaeota archaeon]
MKKEVLDVVTPKDEVIGSASREECHKEDLRHRGVHIFLFDYEGKVLLQKRSKNKDAFPEYYEASLSEHVKKGEEYTDAAIRELKEELGIKAKKEDLRELLKFKMLFGKEHEIITHFTIKYNGEIKPNKREIETCGFITWEELGRMINAMPHKFHPATIIAWQKHEIVKKIL